MSFTICTSGTNFLLQYIDNNNSKQTILQYNFGYEFLTIWVLCLNSTWLTISHHGRRLNEQKYDCTFAVLNRL